MAYACVLQKELKKRFRAGRGRTECKIVESKAFVVQSRPRASVAETIALSHVEAWNHYHGE